MRSGSSEGVGDDMALEVGSMWMGRRVNVSSMMTGSCSDWRLW